MTLGHKTMVFLHSSTSCAKLTQIHMLCHYQLTNLILLATIFIFYMCTSSPGIDFHRLKCKLSNYCWGHFPGTSRSVLNACICAVTKFESRPIHIPIFSRKCDPFIHQSTQFWTIDQFFKNFLKFDPIIK